MPTNSHFCSEAKTHRIMGSRRSLASEFSHRSSQSELSTFAGKWNRLIMAPDFLPRVCVGVRRKTWWGAACRTEARSRQRRGAAVAPEVKPIDGGRVKSLVSVPSSSVILTEEELRKKITSVWDGRQWRWWWWGCWGRVGTSVKKKGEKILLYEADGFS